MQRVGHWELGHRERARLGTENLLGPSSSCRLSGEIEVTGMRVISPCACPGKGSGCNWCSWLRLLPQTELEGKDSLP